MLKRYLSIACKAVAVAAIGLTVALPAVAQDNKVVVAHSTKSFAFLTFFVASANGYFEKTGVEVEETRTGSGSKAMAAMVNGDANIYIGSTATAFKARAQGIPVKIIAPVVRQMTSSVLVSEQWAEDHNVTKDSPLNEKLEALKGSRIAISGPGSGTDQALRWVAIQASLDPDRDITIVPMGSDAATYISAMEAGQIDGFTTSPPQIQIAEKDFNSVILINLAAGEMEALDGYFYIGLMARDDWIEENIHLAARVVKGLQMAMDAVHDPERNAEVAEATYQKYYSDMDRDLFQRVWEDQTNSVPTNLEMSEETMQQVIDFHNMFSDDPLDAATIEDVVTDAVTGAAQSLE